jgi:AAA domain
MRPDVTRAELEQLAAQARDSLGAGKNGRPAHEVRRTVQELVAKHLGAIEFCSHDELMAMDLDPPSWLVSDLVCDDGLTWLGGRKKTGKSWLCLQIAQAVATGGTVLGRQAVQGDVVYLCLEDGLRRLKGRLKKQQAPAGLPITWYHRFPPLDGDGMGALLELLDERRPRLLVLDTLAAAKTGKTDENEAGGMADLGNALRTLGQVYETGILCTHHHGKVTGGDPGDDLRGSSAIGGAGDVNLGLYAEAGGHVLRGEGRDIEQFTLSLAFDPENTWCWQLRADGRAVVNASRRDAADEDCLEALRALGEADTATVAGMLVRSEDRTGKRLRKLAAEGACRARPAAPDGDGRPRILYSVAPRPEEF